jgi:hypothetical protein
MATAVILQHAIAYATRHRTRNTSSPVQHVIAGRTRAEQADAAKEVEILRMVKHANIVQHVCNGFSHAFLFAESLRFKKEQCANFDSPLLALTVACGRVQLGDVDARELPRHGRSEVPCPRHERSEVPWGAQAHAW